MVEKRHFDRVLHQAVAMPVVALAILAAVLALLVTRLLVIDASLDRADEVVASAERLDRMLTDMRSDLRAYILSSQPKYFERLGTFHAALEPTLEGLTSMVAEDPNQSRRLAAIREAALAWTDAAQAAAATQDRDPGHLEKREAMMDALRARIGGFIDTEQALRMGRNRAATLSAAIALAASFGGTILVGIFVGLATRRQMLRLAELYDSAVTQRQLVLQSVGDGIYGVGRDGRITFVNPAASSLLGFAPADAIGLDAHQLFHHSTADGRPYPEESCPVYAAFREGAVRRVSGEVFWRKDGTSFPVSYVSTPIRGMDGVEGAVVSFRDITGEREQEAERQQLLERAQEGVRARDHVLRVISHELRTPLTALKIQVERIARFSKRQGDAPGWAEASAHVEACKGPMSRLEQLVRELLEAAGVYAGDIDMKREPVELAPLVRECTEQLAARAAAAGCSPTLELDERAVGMWDREKLITVVSNLLLNAIEHGHGKPIHVSLHTQGAQAVLSVQYRGLPVSAEDCERLFQPVSVPDVEHHSRGVGVTLYISRELVRALGGTLALRSTSAAGESLCAILPLHGEGGAGEVRAASASSKHA